MALWLVRAGRQGEHETRFFSDNRVYMTWRETREDLHSIPDKKALRELLTSLYPGASTAKISNHTGQIGAFLFGMKPDGQRTLNGAVRFAGSSTNTPGPPMIASTSGSQGPGTAGSPCRSTRLDERL